MSHVPGQADAEVSGNRKWLRVIAFIVGALFAVGALGYAVKSLIDGGGNAKKPSPQVISVLRPQPPPPPPKPEEKPPEPEMKKEEVKLPDPTPDPEPKQADDQPPPGQQLGLDADGSGAGDGFGLAANKGGRDITTIGGEGGGGGGNRLQYAVFTRAMSSQLQERLLGNERLRFAGYRCVVKIWLAGSGSIERTELVGSCGSDEIDSTVRSVLADTSLRQSPPADLPQPVRIRLDSRRSG